MENTNAYAKPVTLGNIMKFAIPTIAMSVFMSFYTMVDGLFVSNLIGTEALSAINLTAPVIQLVTAISTMLATGGSAVIMKKMGEKKREEAKEDFTFLILVNVFVGIVMCALGYLLMGKIFAGMNLSADVAGYCVEYLSRYLLFTVPILLMNNFTPYMIASEKATLSLICSVTGGVLNMALDYVFIAVFHMGIGVAAVTIIMYVLMFASSLYTGYSYGVAPMLSFYHGEQNHAKLKKLVFSSLKVIAVISVLTAAFSFCFTAPLVSIFARSDNPVYGLAVTGNKICTIALIFIGFNIFASGMFTALSNGVVSAVLAFSRSFVFMLVTMIVLPVILGVNGIWLATPVAELMALLLSFGMFFKYRKQYGY